MNDIQIFQFDNMDVRVISKDGEPWWVAKDVCDVLGIQNVSDTLSKVLDRDEKGIDTIDTPGGSQSISIINEPGLYSLILRSRKPEAKMFKRWITHEVIPTIRKTGGYLAPNVDWTDLDNIQRVLDVAKSEREKRLEIEALNAKLKIKADVADSIADSEGLILLSDAGKMICGHPLKFIQWAESSGIIFRRRDYDGLLPKADYDKKYFCLTSRSINGQLRKQLYLTPRGLAWITAKYNIAHGLLNLQVAQV